MNTKSDTLLPLDLYDLDKSLSGLQNQLYKAVTARLE